MEHTIFEQEAGCETDGDVLLKQKWSPISAPTISENDSSCFECNICFDTAHDPVVTLCGHLYCWPCIYKWFHVQTSSLDTDEHQQSCPVCKASISDTSLVPLYGRDTSSKLGVEIPGRPRPSLLNTSVSSSPTSTRHQTPRLHSDILQSQAASFHEAQYFPQHNGGHAALASSSLGGMATISFFNPLMGMLGGMTLERTFGGSSTSLLTYPSHPLLVSTNPRIRRHEMELDRSLNRVSIFLFCCLILCLVLF